jgi:amidohydrolase
MARPSEPVPVSREDLVALRREIHQAPELAFAEHETAARVASYLGATPGLSLRTGVGRTGVVATIGGRNASGSVLLRVDMDALPIQEATAAPYASRRAGVMHACGHDGHVAMGAVAARTLAARGLERTVHVLFQPAEEGHGGAQAVVADGTMEGVERVVGIHLWNELPVGTIGVKAGPLMASVDRLDIAVRGRGGHGASPHRTADPVVAAAHVVVALQTIVAREVAPISSAVVTIGAVHGGEAFNVIPETVQLTGTVRTFEPALRDRIHETIHRVATGIAGGLGCRAEVRVERGTEPVINDRAMAELAHEAAVDVVGAAAVLTPEATMGGEDVSEYFRHAPGCFVFIGSANPARGLSEPHHSPRFDFDEGALAVGCEFLVRAAERLAKQP